MIDRARLILAVIICLSAGVVYAQQPVRVVILPFEIYAEGDLSYLQKEIPTAIKKQLELEGASVLILEVESIPSGVVAAESLTAIRNLGEKTGADYILWGSLTTSALRDSDGSILYYLALVEDITMRKQAEEAGQESESLFRTLFELSPDAVILVDPHDPEVPMRINDCNMAACAMNGYSRDELIGKSVDIVNAAPYTPGGRSEYLERLHKDGSLKLEVLHRRKDGTTFQVEIATALIQVGGRELLIGIDRDISARKQVEEELSRINERFTMATRAARMGVWDWDIQKDILVWDDQMYELYGVNRYDFSGAYEGAP